MRIRRLISLTIVGVTLAAFLVGYGQGWLDMLERAEAPSSLTDASTREDTGRETISYRLDPERWTTFSFPSNANALRILSHADIAPSSASHDRQTFRYGLEMELLDSSGAVLERRTQFFRTELVTYRDEITGAEVTARRYSDDPAVPLAVDRFIFLFPEHPNASGFRIRASAADPLVSAINVRLYRPRPFNKGNTAALWERLADSEKEALSMGFVHSPNVLTLQERTTILSNRWIPFGPIGVEGRDYVSRKLEIYDTPGVRVSNAENVAAYGVLLAPGRKVGLRLPERLDRLRLVTTPVAQASADASPSPTAIELRAVLERPSGMAPEIFDIRLDPTGQADVDISTGGTLVLSSSVSAWVQAIAELPTGGNRDLTEEIMRASYQGVRPGAPIRYSIAHSGTRPSPFRLDLRCVCEGGNPTASVRLLASDGAIVASHTLLLDAVQSEYDRLSRAPEAVLSEVVSRYLSLSSVVAVLEVAALDHPILAAGFSRPSDRARKYDIPEEYFAIDEGGRDNRSWFGMTAELTGGGIPPEFVVERPARLSDAAETIDPESLEFEQFTPLGDWVARRALVPRKGSDVQDEARSTFFLPVPLGQTTTLDFSVGPGVNAVRPSVLLFGANGPPEPHEIDIDGKTVWRGRIAGPDSVVLPAMSAAGHDVRVSGPEEGVALISHVATDVPGFLRRQLLRLSPGETAFEVEKLGPEQEVLSVRLYPVSVGAERAAFDTILDFERPKNVLLSDWTLRKRSFSVRLDHASDTIAPLLLPFGTPLGVERTMYVVLGEDLPPGTYMVTLRSAASEDLLILFSRAVPRKGAIDISMEEAIIR